MKNCLKTIAELKQRTGFCLAQSLHSLREKSFSEQQLAEKWITALRDHKDLYEEGWYSPPPQGIISVFGNRRDNYQRICQSSFRPSGMWPSPDQIWGPETIIAAYASPVQKQSNLIGDFGLTLYSGSDPSLWDHLEAVLRTSIYIAKITEVGMKLCEVYAAAMEFCAQQGFENDIESTTDAVGENIGHTIPLSYQSDATHSIIRGAETIAEIREGLSKGRKFINSREGQTIQPDFAFTIEPRLSSKAMPNIWFHLTVIFENGARKICHGFEPVFEAAGMQRLLRLL